MNSPNVLVSFKQKKDRPSMVAVVGRGAGAGRFELGANITLPSGVMFINGVFKGGTPNERAKAEADKADYYNDLNKKYKVFLSSSPMGTYSAFKLWLKEKKRQTVGFEATLSGWLNNEDARRVAGELSNRLTGNALSQPTLENTEYFINVSREFVTKHGDLDFRIYNSGSIDVVGKAEIVNKYKTLISKYRRFLEDERKLSPSTISSLVARLKQLISSFSKEYDVRIEEELLGIIKSKPLKKNNDEDVVALDADQFDFLIENEELIRSNIKFVKQQDVVDYMIVGLLTCARKHDMSIWDAANLRSEDNGKFRLRFTPNKTKNSSEAVVDLFPLSPRVMKIFNKNLVAHNKLMPELPSNLGMGIRRLMQNYPIFDRIITIRTPKGAFENKMMCDAFKAHSLRSSGITYLLSRGVPEMIVRKVSGHSHTSASFSKYVKILAKNKGDQYEEAFAKFG